MFLKPFKVKSQQPLKSSEKKRIRAEVRSEYAAIDDTIIDDLIPVKEEILIAKLTTYSGDAVAVYICRSDPIFFHAHGHLFPTVYTLWKAHALLPIFHTWRDVIPRLQGGADLMLPGVVLSNAAPLEEVLGSFRRDTPCAVNAVGNGAPFAVGATLMSSEEMVRNNMKGKGVRILHLFEDHLWELGSKLELPVLLDKLVLNDSEGEDNDVMNDCKPDDDADLSRNVVDSQAATAQALSANSTACPEDAAENMDDILEFAMKCVVKNSIKKTDLPLLSSRVVQMMKQYNPTVDIRKSSHKKLSVFLRYMQSKSFLTVQETSKGVDSIVEINRQHAELKELEAGLPEAAETPEPPPSRAVYSAPLIRELFTANANTLPLFKATGLNIQKGAAFTAKELRGCVRQYVTSQKLIAAADGRRVVLDCHLASVLLNKGEYQETMTWETLFDRLENKMGSAYELTFPGRPPAIHKGKLNPIKMTVSQRTGNKKVTLIDNLENYGIDAHEFAENLQKGVAGSTSVSSSRDSASKQVLVQGNHVIYISKVLNESYGLDKKYMCAIDNLKKKK